MQQQEIVARIAVVLEQAAGVDPGEVRPDQRLVEDLELDSLTMVEVTITLEDSFGIAIAEGDAQGFKTVGDVASYIEASCVRA